jgi:4-amino-4-deoxy-L-arabinose transferase-like glycosyltransferase
MKKNLNVILAILLLMIFSVRFIHLSADPPETLSQSAGEYGDPGGYAFNARNKILFGQWEIDLFNPMYHTIIPHFVTYCFFTLFGVGIAQMNLVPVFFGSLILLLMFFLFRKIFDTSIALLAFSTLGINYLFIMYSRIANRIMPMMFFLLLALFFLIKETDSKGWLLPAGIFTFLAFMTKGVCLYILLAFIMGFFLHLIFNYKLKEIAFRIALFASGFLACFAIWYKIIYIPYGYVLKGLSQINAAFLIPPKSITKILVHFWTRPPILFSNMPVLSLTAGFAFIILLFNLMREPHKAKLQEWIMALWFAGGFVYYSIIYQQVTRHFIPQIIPIIFLTLWLSKKILERKSIQKPRKAHLFFTIILFFWLCFPLSKLIKWILPPALSDIWLATALLCLLSVLVTAFIIWGLNKIPDGWQISFSKGVRTTLVIALFVPIFAFQGNRFVNWALHPQFKLKTISRDLGKALEKAVISGLWAPVVCLENGHKAFESYPGYINDDKDFLDKFQITHVFSTDFFGNLEDEYYKRNFRARMQKASLVAKYPIWQGSAFLYKLSAKTDSRQDDQSYEAELFTEKPGMPRFDSEASKGFAIQAEKGKPGIISIISTSRELPKGMYSVQLRIKRKGALSDESRLARIDVTSPGSKKLYKSKNILLANLEIENSYHELTFSFFLRKQAKIMIRFYSYGLTELWIDRIKLELLAGKNTEL